jgi:hypothetical protein
MRPPKTWFWQIKVNENYKNFVEIRKMINAGTFMLSGVAVS